MIKAAVVRILFFLLLVFLLISCVNTKSIGYLRTAKETTYQVDASPEALIQKNDILSITITSLNADASIVFNTSNNHVLNSSASNGSVIQSGGYLVNADGYIQLPILGNVMASGITKKELRNRISEAILSQRLLVDPIVTIRHMNYEVTVIGEVGRPSVINVPNEKISILKALGLAGDITIYGKRDNVLVIREVSGQKTLTRLDLNAQSLLNSPYYYLMPNDIVYVEPNKNKLASVSRGRQLLPAILSGLSVAVIVLDRVL
jgi:polysaccharide export outer membrane protein